MAARESATVFATIFDKLAEDPTAQHRQWALEFWEESDNYDFSPSQMGCDEALQKLGLARRGVNPRHKEGGEVLLYRGCHGAPEWPVTSSAEEDLPTLLTALAKTFRVYLEKHVDGTVDEFLDAMKQEIRRTHPELPSARCEDCFGSGTMDVDLGNPSLGSMACPDCNGTGRAKKEGK
jgi:hypothetical protein